MAGMTFKHRVTDSPQTRPTIIAAIVAVVAGVWLLSSLGNGMLWQDEAQTALLARTTLANGVPIAFDGPNSISEEFGDDYGAHHLWKWHMWLPFYLLAVFFKLFGESTFVARLPFALFGVATVVVSLLYARSIYQDWKTALLSSLLLLSCIPFELLSRQCRYYSPCMFFSLLMLYAYAKICRGSPKAWILLCASGVLLFNCHFLYCATAWCAIAVHAAIWHRQRYRPLLLAASINLILCIAPLVWAAGLNYSHYGRNISDWRFFWEQLKVYVVDLFRYIVPWPLLIVLNVLIGLAVLGATARLRKVDLSQELERSAGALFFALITLALCVALSPFPAFRYLGPLIAPLLIIVARVTVLTFRANAFIGIAVLCLLAWWWPIGSYIHELTHPFTGPTEGVVQLLRDKGRPGDVVVASYEDLALKFYTPYRIVGGWTGEDLTPGEHARWLVIRRNPVNAHEYPVEQFIMAQLKKYHDYRGIRLNAPDTPFENREEPAEHLYSSAQGTRPLVVAERIDSQQP